MDGWDFLDNYDQVEPLDPAQVVWCAGFFDGEGCITFANGQWGSDLHVSVSQRAPVVKPIQIFKDLFGGVVRETHVVTNVAEADMLTWSVTGYHAGGILATLTPFLVVKREQAELATQWVRLSPGRGNKATNEVRALRASLAEKVRIAKRPWLHVVGE